MENSTKVRYHLLDGIRGLVLVSMILYHGSWNLVYMYGMDWPWYHSKGAYLWQQSICWTFILLSGFCWSMGRNPLKRGCMVFGSGLLVTLVTVLVMPHNRVVFGVLTCIGSCMLLMILLEKLLGKMPAVTGLLGSIGLFVLTRNVNRGYLGFEDWRLAALPRSWYRNLLTAYVGMPSMDFYSTDYFSLVPWIFLFVAGYFLYRVLENTKVLKQKLFQIKLPLLDVLGKYSLVVYLLHQPILYGLMELLL